jgi:hypothetical protein
MTVQAGTITGITELVGNAGGAGLMRGYLLAVDFPAYTGATDTFTIAGVGAAIAAKTRKAGTNTMKTDCVPVCVGPGKDTNGQLVYIGACTISTDALNGNLTTDGAGTEITTSTATTGVQLFVPVFQSLID